jgi:hypothetical protein
VNNLHWHEDRTLLGLKNNAGFNNVDVDTRYYRGSSYYAGYSPISLILPSFMIIDANNLFTLYKYQGKANSNANIVL